MTHRFSVFKRTNNQHSLVGKNRFFDTQFWEFLCFIIQTDKPAIEVRKYISSYFSPLYFTLKKEGQLAFNNMAEIPGMACCLTIYFLTVKTLTL